MRSHPGRQPRAVEEKGAAGPQPALRIRIALRGAALARRALARRSPSRGGLATLTVVPRRLKMPLRRDGLDPIAALAERRQREPVARLARVLGRNVWLVTDHAVARSVLADASDYSCDIRSLVGPSLPVIGGLGFTDPPEHTQLRRLLTPSFTARELSAFAPRIDQIVEKRLVALEAGGPVVDFVREFAFPVPFQVITELLGLSTEDRERFRLLGQTRFDVNGGSHGTFGAMSETRDFLLEQVRRQRLDPGDGLIGVLSRTADDGVSDLELAGLVDGVFTGGYETSASMLALGTLTLLRDRETWARLADDEEALNATVEELLRYLSVVQIAFPRFARRELTLQGRTIKSGDVVVCSLSGVNRDPGFTDLPDSFEPGRSTRGHLAFGHGFHRCIGAELARMELRIAFRALARRFPDMAVAAEPADLEFRPLSIVYGVESLPVRLGSPVVTGNVAGL